MGPKFSDRRLLLIYYLLCKCYVMRNQIGYPLRQCINVLKTNKREDFPFYYTIKIYWLFHHLYFFNVCKNTLKANTPTIKLFTLSIHNQMFRSSIGSFALLCHILTVSCHLNVWNITIVNLSTESKAACSLGSFSLAP